MNEFDLRRFDLNLLVVFEALLVERSVTRVAARLGRTQSAISHALSRLRQQLGDPLLIKGGRRMEPTSFALHFMTEIQPILRNIRRVVSPRHAFDPTTSRRLFRIAAPDFALTLFTRLLARLRTDAPGVSIEWTTLRKGMLADLAEGQLDVALAPTPARLTDEVTGEEIGGLTWRCFARGAHPAFLRWSTKTWSRWPHLAVRLGDGVENPVDLASTSAGIRRTIAGWVPTFAAMAPALAATDMLATLPAIAMADMLHPYCLASRAVPFAIAPMPHAVLWSASRSNDPEIRWLRERLLPIAKDSLAG